MQHYTNEEISKIVRKNKTLERENKYLKKLVESKRFKFGEKIANGYNVIFPKNTIRRKITSKIGANIQMINTSRQDKKNQKISSKILDMAANYKKVIVLNSIIWNIELKQRPHHLATELAKQGFFVIYLEYDNPIQKMRIIQDNLITVNSDKYLQLLPQKHTCYFLTPNNMPTSYQKLQEIKQHGYHIIYDYLDEFHEDISGDLSVQLEVWDNLKLLSPVLCIATAKRLYDNLKKHLGNKQKIIIAKNAVNIDHFDYTKNNVSEPPYDFKKVIDTGRPIIGFYGALAPWIDFELLNQTAENHKEWSFVYIGSNYNNAAIKLNVAENVYCLGAKQYVELPQYAKYFNCAIIPFKHGEIAKATSPVKLFEYMAAGLPTVCTRDLEECKGYEYVFMSKNNQEFEKNLSKAINLYNDINIRKQLLLQAKQNTWEMRVKDIIKNLR